MSFVPDGDGHVRSALGLYFLGGLGDDDEAAVERHLATCAPCLDEYDSLGDVPSYLDVLDANDGDELAGQPGTGAGPVPPVPAPDTAAVPAPPTATALPPPTAAVPALPEDPPVANH